MLNQPLFDTVEINDLNVHILSTDKFKTTTMIVHIEQDLNEKTVTQTALIPFVLKRGCAAYPSTQQLRQYTDELFGAVFHADIIKKGEKQIIQIQLEVANERYLADKTPLLKKGIEFLGSIVSKPLIENGGFRSSYVASEADTLKKRISSLIDDKIRYANQRLIEEMCEDEPYRLFSYGKIEELDQVDPVQLFQYYEQLLAENPIDIYIVGDVESQEIQSEINRSFQIKRSGSRTRGFNPVQKKAVKEQVVVDQMDIGQGKLNIGCRTNTTIQDEDYETLLVYNGILGGFPHSKLFVNVREKASLAYYAVSRLESHKGLLIMMSGIESARYDQTVEIMKEQLSMMKNGQISETEINQTKAALTNQLLEIRDKARTIIDFTYNGQLSQTKRSLEQILERVNQVTLQDITTLAQKIEIDTIYFLRDKEDE